MNKNTRFKGIDIFRGWAIFLMVIFHFSFDLNYFSYIDIDIRIDTFWIYFRLIIVNIFIFTVGMSLKLTHLYTINWKSVQKRVLLLGGASLLVTFGSYLLFPQSWIYFGVLHFILFSSLIILPFLNYPFISIIVGLLILIGYILQYIHMHWLFNLISTPLHLPLEHTEDIIRFTPWFALILFGSATITLNWHYKLFNNKFFNANNRFNNFFSFLGKNSLAIYLLHQPLLFGIFSLLK